MGTTTIAAMFDFDAALEQTARPPLPHADGSLGEIRAPEAFTRLVEGWAEWLIELRRVLADDGRLEIGLFRPESFDELTGYAWDESRIGMTVLSALDEPGHRLVFHSEWWLRAHWGRGFDIVSIGESGGRRRAVLTKRPGELTAHELRRPDPGDERELAAAQQNTAYLVDQLSRAEERHRGELEGQREEMSRELMRRSFAAADAEWARGGPGSPASLVAAEYEGTTSWRLTKPLRDLGRLFRRAR
jgi:hypothetical protein